MALDEVIFPQDINLTLSVKVSAGVGNVADIDIPQELRLTEKVFLLLNQLIEAQGLKLGNMNITPLHVEEVKSLTNVLLVEKQAE